MNKAINILYIIITSHTYRINNVVYLKLGDLKNARNFAEEALRLSQKNNEKFVEGLSMILLGRILVQTEPQKINKAEEYIQKGIEIFYELKTRPDHSLGYLFLGEVYADTGQKEKALEHLKKAEERFREMGMDYYLAKTQAVLEKL